MKLTKYTHACIVLQEQGQRLVIDPGKWSTDFTDFANITAVVVTHDHFDHFEPQIIQAITQANPQVKIYTTDDTAQKLKNIAQSVQVVAEGTTLQAGPFSLQFYGHMHALVNNNKPQTQNVGVLVNNNLYYPGDSFALPSTPVKTLALPVSGPWLKTEESIAFMMAIKPQVAFPTHDALLSKHGVVIYENWYQPEADDASINFVHLLPGNSIEIN